MSFTSLSSISMFQALSATSTGRNSSEISNVSITATPRCSTHLPIPMRTVKSLGFPRDSNGHGPVCVYHLA